MTPAELKPWRSAARALVLDRAGATLLVHYDSPPFPWVPPGGGVEPGESDEHALRRELWEELGLREFELGPCVWTREAEFPEPVRFRGQRERIYLVRVEPFEPQPQLELQDEGVDGVRWWRADEIAASDEVFAPRRLSVLLRRLLDEGPPAQPIDVSV